MKLAIIGAGQLAQMLAHAAHKLNIETSFVAENTEDARCVEGLGTLFRKPVEAIDAQAMYLALGSPDVITVEREDVSFSLLKQLQQYCTVHPNPESIQKTQHRYQEKQALCDLNIPVAPFRLCTSFAEAKTAITDIGLPVFIKSCEQGYDGKNQWRIKETSQLDAIEDMLNVTTCVIEGAINYNAEVSFIAVRSADKEVKFYPATENYHHNGILLTSIAPSQTVSEQDHNVGQEYLARILESWDYVGVLAMECFVTDTGLIINELAPRVHNSGHWTMNSAAASQFENHIRAICGKPLGSTEISEFYAMLNLLGHDNEATVSVTSETTHHSYQKTTRPGRKMGHINLHNHNLKTLQADLETLKHNAYPDMDT